MASISEAFSSSWKAKDLEEGESIRLTIKGCKVHQFKDDAGNPTEKKLMVSFNEDDKDLVCNLTNAKEIAKSYGDDYEKWAGNPIKLYRTMTQYGADMVPCIRVIGPKSGKDAAPPPSFDDAPEPEAGDPGPTKDDDMPF